MTAAFRCEPSMCWQIPPDPHFGQFFDIFGFFYLLRLRCWLSAGPSRQVRACHGLF